MAGARLGGEDAAIKARFAGSTERAMEGDLDQWTSDTLGRLALLDQFSRAVWSGNPRALAQDTCALDLRSKAWRAATPRR